MTERRRGKSGASPQTPLLAEEEPVVYGTPLAEATTEFGRRNPLLVRRPPQAPPLLDRRCARGIPKSWTEDKPETLPA